MLSLLQFYEFAVTILHVKDSHAKLQGKPLSLPLAIHS